MSAGAFDGSEYRRAVLTPLRERNPSEVDDLFWLAHVPRELDDATAITARLKETKGFLNKERSRARQAAIAAAVLKEWPRVEGVLTDAAARRALRDRLKTAPQPGAAAAGRTGATRRRTAAAGDPAARRRRQVTSNLNELARLRDEPELAHDLFAFLGLPMSATRPMIEERIVKVGEVNRRRRPDRERTLVDELLEHSRELLVQGDPATYLAGSTDATRDAVVDALLAGDAAGARQALARARASGVSDASVLAGLTDVAAQAGDVVPVSAIGLGIWCPVCTTVNAAGAHVCASCGSALTMSCTNCRTPVAVDLVSCTSCGTSLAGARAPLVARRDQQREELTALAQVQATPEAERPALLARLAAQHPEWAEVRRRAASAPPRSPAQVTVILDDGEARLTWPQSDEAGVDYLVERIQGGSTRVLGRTAVTTWTDAHPAEPGTTWQVRTLRGEQASPPTVATRAGGEAATPAPSGGLTAVQAVADVPVLLSWKAPPGAEVVLVRVERRPDGDVQRRLYVDPAGYRDRQVARGRRYEYRVSIEGAAGRPVVLELEAGAGGTVTPAGPRAAPRPQPPPPSPPPAPARPPAHALLIEGVGAARDADGRLRVTWSWPSGVTEAYVAFDAQPPHEAGGTGRKVTNMRYELDGGALIDGVPAGAHVAVFAGKRDRAGTLTWGAAEDRSRTVAP